MFFFGGFLLLYGNELLFHEKQYVYGGRLYCNCWLGYCCCSIELNIEIIILLSEMELHELFVNGSYANKCIVCLCCMGTLYTQQNNRTEGQWDGANITKPINNSLLNWNISIQRRRIFAILTNINSSSFLDLDVNTTIIHLYVCWHSDWFDSYITIMTNWCVHVFVFVFVCI